MSITILKIRQISYADRLNYTPAVRELICEEDSSTLFIGDGKTVGGVAVVESAVTNATVKDTDVSGEDEIVMVDSESLGMVKKLSYSAFKAALRTDFDAVYASLNGGTNSDMHVPVTGADNSGNVLTVGDTENNLIWTTGPSNYDGGSASTIYLRSQVIDGGGARG